MKSKLLQLFSVFFKIGAFTFGGGYAMIPLMQRETVEKHHWISDEDILEVVAIAESTPGPIAINASTFIGYKVAGFFGSLVATTATVLPSFVIILAISFLLQEFQDLQPIAYAFMGIRAGVLALLIKALYNMYKKMPKTGFAYLIAIGSFLAAAIFDVKVLLVIIGCGVLGLLYGLFWEGRKKE